MAVKIIKKVLDLKPEAVLELKKIDGYDFDVFKLREATDGHELETVLLILLGEHGFFKQMNVELDTMIKFVRALA